MKKSSASLIVTIAAFLIGVALTWFCFYFVSAKTSTVETIPQNETSSGDLEANFNKTVLSTKSFVETQEKQSSNPLYLGCWGGTHGGLLRISRSKIYDDLEGRNFLYEEILKSNKVENKYFLQLKSNPQNSYIRKFVVIKFLKKDDVAYFGYNSLEDYQNNKPFISAGEFFKQDCKTIK